MRVLVVDDSRAMRMIVTRALREVDLVEDVAEAESAEMAVDMLMAEPVDLVVCDWNMGGMTGLELLEALRAAGWTVPFGFVTSESSAEILAAAVGAGASFLLAKPFRTEELADKVTAVLGGGQVPDDQPLGSGPVPAGTGQAGLPPAERQAALEALLGGLLGRAVEIAPVDSGPPRQAPRWTAEYLDPAGTRVAVCVVEAPLASAMSAALTMMPPSVAAEWASAGALPDALRDNFHEVTNVIAKTVHAGGDRCLLGEIAGFAPGEQLPCVAEIAAAKRAESYEVCVEGYGAGVLSLVTL